MKIKTIKVNNFKSLREIEVTAASFNVFVGQNNHGKTNLFQAIEWFYTGKTDTDAIRHINADASEEVSVEIEFSEAKQGLDRITSEDNKTKLRSFLGDSDTMRVRRITSLPKERSLLHPESGQWKKAPTGADSAFNNCIPRFEFIETSKNLKEVSAYKKNTPIEQMLGAVVAEKISKDPAYTKFKTAFDAFFQGKDSGVRRTLDELSGKGRRQAASAQFFCIIA